MDANCSIPRLATSALAFTSLALASHLPHFKHEAMSLYRRQQAGPSMPPGVITSTTAPGVLTIITPAPGAAPITVTSQSQIVTSYVPEFTLCELPPIAFFETTPLPSARPTTAPYHNYSISIPPDNGTCTTIYSKTDTMVCATVLPGIATQYTVTDCAQDITFSSQFGYVLAMPTPTTNRTANYSMPNSTAIITPAPKVQTLTTYYLAPWQELTSTGPPTDVNLKVCTTWENGTEECIREYQVWQTQLVNVTTSSIISINLSTAIPGPSQMIIENFVANITERITTFSMSTTILTEFQTEIETTSVSTLSASTGPTVYETFTLEKASSTSTTTIHLTSTIYAGTTTITAATPSAASASASVDFASMLGVGS